MSDTKLTLELRETTGKKAKLIRAQGKIPSVIYGGKTPILASSDYNPTEKALRAAGYHSPIELELNKKTILSIVKNISIDPVSRRIINVEFNEIKKNALVEATTPIKIEGFEASEANKLHLALLQTLEEIDVKAKPSDLPNELTADASKLASIDDKLTIRDLLLPKGVELADKELDENLSIAILSDPAAEAEKREKEAEESTEIPSASDVPADNGQKPETSTEE